jgi:Xaa-Pro aminopeptidase
VSSRIARLRERLEEPLLVTNLVNIRYLCGFDSSNAALFVEQERVRLFTDFRYIHSAHEVEGVEVVETRRSLVAHLAEMLTGRVAFETVLPYVQYETLASGGLDLVPRGGIVEALRAVKDEQELELLRRICAITDRVYERLLDVPFVLFHDEGGESIAFELIVGAGPTGSHPHGRAGERKIEAGELVVVDAGCSIDGYSSDYTRTLATGPVDAEAKEAYAVVLSAQEAALGAMRAGVPAIEVDATARRIIDESPFAGKFGHGLGHGLGLDVHEAPRMSPETSDVLEAGNVITVEPGVYVEGKFGVRIEDDVVVTAGGIENLTGFRKDLVEVG